MHTLFNKKTHLAILLALACVALWPGCDKKEEPTGPECNISGVTFTYNTNIKPIIDKHCISCHATGSGVAQANQFDFTTYEGMKPHLDEGHVLDRVVIKKDMPQGNPTNMTQAERDSINCWILSGYPKN
ncbi:MAG TPA: hypothetical protein PK228_09595 [Saprospiraceae bacterium]|nr:hypothetical protein [Saprospiraceae bacterium]